MRIINKHEGPSATYTSKIESLWRMMLRKPDSVELFGHGSRERERARDRAEI